MNALFAAVESSGLSTWLRESTSLLAFPFVLILHTVGLGFLVGANVAIDLRVIGLAAEIPAARMTRYIPVAWAGFWVNAVSGVLLLIAYPTKALTNPIFYVKLALVAVGLILMVTIARGLSASVDGRTTTASGPGADAVSTSTRRLAMLSLVCWAAAIASGRLLAYTYRTLLTI